MPVYPGANHAPQLVYMPPRPIHPASNAQRALSTLQEPLGFAAPPPQMAACVESVPPAQTAQQQADMSHEADVWGWLYKKKNSGPFAQWDCRWFELHGSSLAYWERQKGTVPCRVISLQGSRVERGQATPGRHTFFVTTPGCNFADKYVLSADDAAVRKSPLLSLVLGLGRSWVKNQINVGRQIPGLGGKNLVWIEKVVCEKSAVCRGNVVGVQNGVMERLRPAQRESRIVRGMQRWGSRS